jgi:hypothetical protein
MRHQNGAAVPVSDHQRQFNVEQVGAVTAASVNGPAHAVFDELNCRRSSSAAALLEPHAKKSRKVSRSRANCRRPIRRERRASFPYSGHIAGEQSGPAHLCSRVTAANGIA